MKGKLKIRFVMQSMQNPPLCSSTVFLASVETKWDYNRPSLKFSNFRCSTHRPFLRWLSTSRVLLHVDFICWVSHRSESVLNQKIIKTSVHKYSLSLTEGSQNFELYFFQTRGSLIFLQTVGQIKKALIFM